MAGLCIAIDPWETQRIRCDLFFADHPMMEDTFCVQLHRFGKTFSGVWLCVNTYVFIASIQELARYEVFFYIDSLHSKGVLLPISCVNALRFCSRPVVYTPVWGCWHRGLRDEQVHPLKLNTTKGSNARTVICSDIFS